jgi:hypothetical protein
MSEDEANILSGAAGFTLVPANAVNDSTDMLLVMWTFLVTS